MPQRPAPSAAFCRRVCRVERPSWTSGWCESRSKAKSTRPKSRPLPHHPSSQAVITPGPRRPASCGRAHARMRAPMTPTPAQHRAWRATGQLGGEGAYALSDSVQGAGSWACCVCVLSDQRAVISGWMARSRLRLQPLPCAPPPVRLWPLAAPLPPGRDHDHRGRAHRPRFRVRLRRARAPPPTQRARARRRAAEREPLPSFATVCLFCACGLARAKLPSSAPPPPTCGPVCGYGARAGRCIAQGRARRNHPSKPFSPPWPLRHDSAFLPQSRLAPPRLAPSVRPRSAPYSLSPRGPALNLPPHTHRGAHRARTRARGAQARDRARAKISAPRRITRQWWQTCATASAAASAERPPPPAAPA